jgi:hypothetical protein
MCVQKEDTLKVIRLLSPTVHSIKFYSKILGTFRTYLVSLSPPSGLWCDWIPPSVPSIYLPGHSTHGMYIEGTLGVSSQIRTLMMGTEIVPETSVSTCNQLMRLCAQEDFTEFSRRESFKLYIIVVIPVTYSEPINVIHSLPTPCISMFLKYSYLVQIIWRCSVFKINCYRVSDKSAVWS